MKQHILDRIAELENEGKLKEIVMRQNEDVEEAILQQIHLDQISGAIDELIDALEHYEQQVQVVDAEEAANTYVKTLTSHAEEYLTPKQVYLAGWAAHALQGGYTEEDMRQYAEYRLDIGPGESETVLSPGGWKSLNK